MGRAAAASPLCLGDLLRAQHGRFHGVGFDRHVGDGAHDFLLVLDRLHVFLRGCAGGEQAELLGLRHQFAFFGERAFQFFAHRRAGEHFVHQLLDGGHQRQLAAHGALQQKSGDDEAVDFVGAFEDAVDAGVAVGALGRDTLRRSRSRRRSARSRRPRSRPSPSPRP